MKANVQLDKISGLKTAKHSCLHHCSLALEVGKKDIRACMDLGEQGEWKEHLWTAKAVTLKLYLSEEFFHWLLFSFSSFCDCTCTLTHVNLNST